MKNIVFLDTYSVGAVDLSVFEQFGKLTCYHYSHRHEVAERCQNADVVITNKVRLDEETLRRIPSVKLVCIAATGMNNIDLGTAEQLGIAVRNVVDYSTHSVAQATVAMLLSLVHQTAFYDHHVKSGNYSASKRFTCHDRPFMQLAGKRWGIIGLGNIGKRVATIAEAFGAHVSYYSTSGQNNRSNYPQQSLEELLSSSDVVSIHCPLNPQTDNLLNYARLSLMKPSAFLVNVARGKVVNEADLCRALNEHRLAGAALDVFEREPLPADNPLLTSLNEPDRLLCAPHIAWASIEARQLLIDRIAENIATFRDASQPHL